MGRWRRRVEWVGVCGALVAGMLGVAERPRAAEPAVQSEGSPRRAVLSGADPVQLPGLVDSNSPAVWTTTGGRRTLTVFTSVAGQPSAAAGFSLRRMGAASPASVQPWPGGGVWMEAVVPDGSGRLYGFYHNELVADACGDTALVSPRIGMAVSDSHRTVWRDLGVVLQAAPGTFACDTNNRYNVGGVGDFSALLDHDGRWLYLYFSQYGREVGDQGVTAARLLWADRDQPAGAFEVWYRGVWLPAGQPDAGGGAPLWTGPDADGSVGSYPGATAIFPTPVPWHAGPVVDAFWGPSIHWNTALGEYVMLLNRAHDPAYAQQGIYVSYASTLDRPAAWSTPAFLMPANRWYPQVMGLEPGAGTDKEAGAVARLFVSGQSQFLVSFSR